MIIGFPLSPRQNSHFQATRQFFHSQCIQSMEPNILGKSCASRTLSKHLVSSLLGIFKYCGPKIVCTPITNLSKHSTHNHPHYQQELHMLTNEERQCTSAMVKGLIYELHQPLFGSNHHDFQGLQQFKETHAFTF
jgi:hypothetical protein